MFLTPFQLARFISRFDGRRSPQPIELCQAERDASWPRRNLVPAECLPADPSQTARTGIRRCVAGPRADPERGHGIAEESDFSNGNISFSPAFQFQVRNLHNSCIGGEDQVSLASVDLPPEILAAGESTAVEHRSD